MATTKTPPTVNPTGTVQYKPPTLNTKTPQQVAFQKPNIQAPQLGSVQFKAPTYSWQSSGSSNSGGQNGGSTSGSFPQISLNQPQLSTLPGQQNRLEYDQTSVTNAQNAAFAQAKDQAARTAQAALRGLSGQLAARGMGGAGYEAGQIGREVVRGANTIGEASRAQAIQAAELAQRAAELNYTGGITQRGQDLSAGSARDSLLAQLALGEYQGGISQRGQDMSQAANRDSLSLQQALAEYQGGLTQRGQDLSSQQAYNALLAGLAETEFSGGISQRGQDLDWQQALNALQSNNYNTQFSGNVTQRGQDISSGVAQRGQDIDFRLGQGDLNLREQEMRNQQANQEALLALQRAIAMPPGSGRVSYDSYGNPYLPYLTNRANSLR